MLEVYRAAEELQRRCDAQGWRFCLIGGLALQRWGEPRVPDAMAFALKGEPEIMARLESLRERGA